MTERGDTCDAAANILQVSLEADRFGNTPLHLFAALDSPLGIQTTIQLINLRWTNPLAVNKAGQTFLHTLSSSWFSAAGDLNAPLYGLLNTLYMSHKDLVFVRDVYGRTFFHQLQRYVHDPQIMNRIVQQYTWSPIPRDAFGVTPALCAVDQSFPPPRRTGTIALAPLAEETPEDSYAARYSGLAFIVTNAYNNPAIEDEDGRNGFHCLAEMNFTSSNPNTSSPSSPDPNNPTSPVNTKGSLKRKHGKDDVEKPISKRLQYLNGLLTPVSITRPPDVNHYDKKGNTVLMAFATHLLDDQDDKTGQNIGKILDLLIQNGAKVDARNRRGETALLVAARCGNKHVVSNLLDKGANLYARDKHGRGIMAIIDAQISQSSRDLPSYGRLEAVRAAVLAKKLEERGGNDEPSFLDEWCWPQKMQTSGELTS
jgi:ankyrin repeat protein